MADEPELQKNQSGKWVQYLQQLLQHAGYWSGEANREFNDQLELVVMQFQNAYGISADGVVRQDTWDALTGSSSGDESGEEGQDDQLQRLKGRGLTVMEDLARGQIRSV